LLFTVTVKENGPLAVGVKLTLKVVLVATATELVPGAVAETVVMLLTAAALVPLRLSVCPPFWLEIVKVTCCDEPKS
jgi:hypothetical protein